MNKNSVLATGFLASAIAIPLALGVTNSSTVSYSQQSYMLEEGTDTEGGVTPQPLPIKGGATGHFKDTPDVPVTVKYGDYVYFSDIKTADYYFYDYYYYMDITSDNYEATCGSINYKINVVSDAFGKEYSTPCEIGHYQMQITQNENFVLIDNTKEVYYEYVFKVYTPSMNSTSNYNEYHAIRYIDSLFDSGYPIEPVPIPGEGGVTFDPPLYYDFGTQYMSINGVNYVFDHSLAYFDDSYETTKLDIEGGKVDETVVRNVPTYVTYNNSDDEYIFEEEHFYNYTFNDYMYTLTIDEDNYTTTCVNGEFPIIFTRGEIWSNNDSMHSTPCEYGEYEIYFHVVPSVIENGELEWMHLNDRNMYEFYTEVDVKTPSSVNRYVLDEQISPFIHPYSNGKIILGNDYFILSNM